MDFETLKLQFDEQGYLLIERLFSDEFLKK